MNAVRILHVTDEAPSDLTERAEYVAGLARALDAAGHPCTVVAPRPEPFDAAASRSFARRLNAVSVEHEGTTFELTVYEGKLRGGRVSVYLLHHEAMRDAARRASLLGMGAVALADTSALEVDLVHAHGKAAAESLRAAVVDGLATVFTDEDSATADERQADVSTHWTARLCGVDPTSWNPESDGFLTATYGADDLEGKYACRDALRREIGSTGEGPVVATFGPLPQELHETLAQLVEPDGGCVVSLDGDRMRQHRVLAGSDFLFVDSGGGSRVPWILRAMRYGTVPIVPAGPFFDEVVVHYDRKSRSGSGFRFVPDAAGMVSAIRRALQLHAEDGLDALRKRLMAADRSWHLPARRFVEIYSKLVDQD